jgi:hypothetical protein
MEAVSRLPRDATVVAILTTVTLETAVALGSLRRRGFAVTALINVYEERDYAEAAGHLLAERVDCLHLKDESSVSTVCRSFVLH